MPGSIALPGICSYLADMLDKSFSKWWLQRVRPWRDVPAEKLAAERQAMDRQQEFNRNYDSFLKQALLPELEHLVRMLVEGQVIHRVSSWGNQISVRIHLNWKWAELAIFQSHEDCITFDHHIFTEGERRTEGQAEDHSHHYDLHTPLPASVAGQELQFFLARVAQDLVEPEPEPEIPPGETQA